LIWARAEGSRVWDADGREFLVVDAWDFGEEDLYTHMHSGNPLACAAGLVVLEEVPKLLSRTAVLSERFGAEERC